jgi:hypothetical protein
MKIKYFFHLHFSSFLKKYFHIGQQNFFLGFYKHFNILKFPSLTRRGVVPFWGGGNFIIGGMGASAPAGRPPVPAHLRCSDLSDFF